MINNYVRLMILYLPFNVYGYPEVITDIKLYICLKYTLHLYIMDDKNILPTNILTSLVTYNSLESYSYIEVIHNTKFLILILKL